MNIEYATYIQQSNKKLDALILIIVMLILHI